MRATGMPDARDGPEHRDGVVMTDFAEQRLNMVESQVRPSDVTDRRIIRAMAAIPRELFVPASRKAVAYMDESVPLSSSRALLSPRVLAKLVQLADIADGATVLDVGAATGYTAAILARLAKRVVALEVDDGLRAAAAVALQAVHAATVSLVAGPLPGGSPVQGPYDAIILEGSVAGVPRALLDQLKDGGRLVAILDAAVSKATVWTRSGTAFDTRDAFDAAGAILPGFERRVVFAL
jgi:protein-L-isoaspartate(D-aspartate) O-methyltransferase